MTALITLIDKESDCADYADEDQCNQNKISEISVTDSPSISVISDRGFTLIELMIAASIIGVIGLTILTTFASGFRVYERVQTYGGVQADVLLALEEMERDLRNVLILSSIGIEGDGQRIAFPAIIETLKEEEGEERVASSIGKISYYYDSSDEALIKTQQDYGQAASGQSADDDQINLLADIDGMTLGYYSFDAEKKSYSWASQWDTEETNQLIGVKIEVTFKDGDRNVELARTVFVKASPEIPEEEEEEEEEEGEGEGEG